MDGKALPDEAALVGRARQGDREAFTQLVMHYQVPLYNMALRMIGRPEDAADVAQDAFLRAWEKIRSLRNAPFKPWLFQIGVNLCYDHFRRGRRLGLMPDEEQGGKVLPLGAAQPDPQERALAREDFKRFPPFGGSVVHQAMAQEELFRAAWLDDNEEGA